MSGDMETLPPMTVAEQVDLLAMAFAAGFGREVPTEADRASARDMLGTINEAGAEIARQA